jgi:hypothetical protein
MNIAEAHKYYEEEVKPILSGGEFARRMKEAIDEAEKMTEFYNASIAEHRKSIELIEELEHKVECLWPVFVQAKVMMAAYAHATTEGCVSARHKFFDAVKVAAMELEDSNE